MKLEDIKSKFKKGTITKPEFIAKCAEFHQSLFEYVDAIGKSDVESIKINSEGVYFTFADFAICLSYPENEARVVPLETLNFGSYEAQETKIMDIVSEGCRTIVDVGANIGWFSIRFAKADAKAKVYSFEPLPESYSYLQKNIAINNVGSQVYPFNYGLSDKTGGVKYFIAPKNGTNASLKNVANSNETREISGLTLTMDEFVKNYDVAPDFIKCDVEGAELLVFKGGKNAIERYKPIVFAEMLRKWTKPFGYHPNDIISFFKNLGYCCFAISEDSVKKINIVTEETVETNYVFLCAKKHSHLIKKLEYL